MFLSLFKRSLILVVLVASCTLLLNLLQPVSAFAQSASVQSASVQTRQLALSSDDISDAARAQAPRTPLFIFLQGIDTSLDQAGVTAGNTGSGTTTKITGLGTIPDAIRTVLQFKTAPFREYTYPIDKEGQNQGIPHPYACTDTFTHTLDQDIRTLSLQIANYAAGIPNPDIYLVAHSLGGVVAFGYVAGLIEKASGVSLPSGASLKAVITLDSPIGGIFGGISDSNYLTAIKYLYTTKDFVFRVHIGGISVQVGQPFHNPAFCSGLDRFASNQFTTLTDLTEIFASASHPGAQPGFPLGANASIFEAIFHGMDITNETIATQANQQLGTAILTIGNRNDFTWNPSICIGYINLREDESLPTNIPYFTDTQWLADKGDRSVYGRDFTAGHGVPCNGTTFIHGLNHSYVKTDKDVQKGIEAFLSPLGSTPSPLAVPPSV